MTVSLLYNRDQERPRDNTVQVRVDPELDPDTFQSFKETFDVFYEHSLSDAIEKCFHE